MKLLADDHVFNAPLGKGNLAGAEQLLIDELNLLLQQLDFDKNAYTVWRKKLATAKGAQVWKAQEKRLDRLNDCKAAADLFYTSCIRLTAQESPDKIVAEILDFKRNCIMIKTGAKSIAHVFGI